MASGRDDSDSDLLPLDESDTGEDALALREPPAAASIAAPPPGVECSPLPDELPISDDDVLDDEELARPSSCTSRATDQRGGFAEVDERSAFSLAPTGQRPGKGRGRGGRRRGRPRQDFSLVPSNLRTAPPPQQAEPQARGFGQPSAGSRGGAERILWGEIAQSGIRAASFGDEPMPARRPLLPSIQGGFSIGFPIALGLVAAMDQGMSGHSRSTQVGEEISKCTTHFFGGGDSLRIVSCQTLSELLNVDFRVLPRHMARLACTFIGMDWGLRACLDMVITSSLPRMALVRFIECACYDETPLRMQASQSLQSALAAPTDTSSEALTQAVGRAISCLGPEARVTQGSAKSSGVQKLVQTQVEFGCLVRIGSKLVTFIGHQVCPLAIVQRTTASVFAHLQQRLSLTSRMALLFRWATRSVVADSYSAIVAAER